MNTVLFVPLLLALVLTPAFGQLLSDKTGLVNRLDVEVDGHTFEIETVSNFDIVDHRFDKNKKQLTIITRSMLENNLGELIIPQALLGGVLTFYLNEEPYVPVTKSSDKISFVTLNFTGTGTHKIDIIGTNVYAASEESSVVIDDSSSKGGGCLIATATYGTELAPQIQQLRETRERIMHTESGQLFLKSFNAIYYSFSPAIADYERENPVFKESVRFLLTPMISSLSILGHVPVDTDMQVFVVGVSIIVLNMGMYLAAPALVMFGLNRRKNR